MQGKKIDANFVSNFIVQCAERGFVLQNEIVNEAKSQISSIDKKIEEVEKLKVTRSKLIDVVYTFEKKKKILNKEEVDSLQFFNIKNQNICKYICDSIKNKPVPIDFFIKSKFNTQDVLFSIKQLMEYKVIDKSNNFLIKGSLFDNYLKSVFLE